MLQDRERLAREAVRKAKKNLPWLFSKEGSQRLYRAHAEVANIEKLVALAREGDKDALEILRRYADGARRVGMIVPPALHEFVWEFFVDGQPKAKPGSSPKDTFLTHLAIERLVKIVSQNYGFSEYSNPEHRGSADAPMTACRLVGEEFGLSERTVEDILAARRRLP